MIDEKLRLLAPVLGTMKVLRLRQMYLYEDDFRQKKEIENYIDMLVARHVKKNIDKEVILPPPPYTSCQGDIEIGEVEYLGKPMYPFCLKLKDVNRHLGVFGATGSGKTTFAKNLIRSLHKKGIPFLIFDWEKSYRNLVKEFPDVQVFTVGTDIHPLYLNILNVPPGIKSDEFTKGLIQIISEDYIGGIGADTMLLIYMEMAYMENRNPTFEDLKQIVLREIQKDMKGTGRLSGRSGLWKQSVSRQVTFLSKGAAGRVVGSRKHYPIEKLLNKPTVLEFGNLKSNHDRKFFIHVILNWLSLYCQYNGILSEELKHVLIFEEFHNIAMRGREDNMVSTLFREIRKYGVGLVAIDQTPSEIPNSIFANMNVKISFALNTNKDISAMAKAMNLDKDKARFLGMLETGQAIINVKQRHNDSFLIRPPFIQQDENISDEELRKAMSGYLDEHITDKPTEQNAGPVQCIQDKDTVPPLEKCLLADIASHPHDSVTQRINRLGFHAKDMVDLSRSLIEKELIKSATVEGKRLFELTHFGKNIAKEIGIHVPKQESKGGSEHSYWVNKTACFLRNLEFEPELEMSGIDIVDRKAGIAIEIETGKSDIPSNIQKLKASRIPYCFMLATNRAVEHKLKSLTTDNTIKAYFIKDFLKLTKEQLTKHHIIIP